MHLFYMAVRLYPYWACATLYVLVEVGIFFRRKRHPVQYLIGFIMVSLIIGLGLWGWYRGDINGDKWVRSLIQD